MSNFSLLLLSAHLIGAAPSSDLSSDISSDYASYDGDFLRLVGDVKLYHDLGKMQAKQALLKKGDKDFPFTKMHLEDDVFFSFQNESELFCDEAELDFIQKVGSVFSHEDPVLYRNRKEQVLDLTSQQIDFQFEEQEDHVLEVSSLIAKDNVHVDYANQYHLDSDRACFDNETLAAFQVETPCHLTHYKDEVDASKITIYLENRHLEMDSPTGKVSSFFFPDAPNRLCRFSSKHLIWDDVKNMMTLHQDIFIQDDFLGTITGDKTIRFYQREQFGKYVIQSIETEGKTTLKSTGASEAHALTSFGTLTLDRDLLLLTGTSPKIDGIVPLDQQLIFKKGDLTLFADDATLEYSICQMELQPTAVDLSGHVRLLSSDPETPFRCGYADDVRFNPQTKRIRLVAKPGSQVLFWHEEQNLKLSAQEIVITPDSQTGKDIIKGIGNVRFSFNDEQQEMLQKLFPQGGPNL